MTPKAIIFDLNGVFIKRPFLSNRFRDDFGVPETDFLPALSNNLAERAKFYDDTFPWLKELFEKVYYSWQTGFIKPDPRCWQTILTENNLNPDDCVYFDDSETNIQTANELGIKSYLFTDAEDVKKSIRT